METFMGIVGAVVVFLGAVAFFMSSVVYFKQGLLEKGAAYLGTSIFMAVGTIFILWITFDGGSDDGNWF